MGAVNFGNICRKDMVHYEKRYIRRKDKLWQKKGIINNLSE